MSDISYPRPDNVRGRFGRWVTADVFHIAQRMQEVDPNLFIQHLDPPVTMGDEVWHFAIVEYVPHGRPPEQLVTRLHELDSRAIEHVQYLLRVPFAQRLALAEQLEDKAEAERRSAMLDEALEDWGWDFRRQLKHDGFITSTGSSYPTRAIKPTTLEPAWRQGH